MKSFMSGNGYEIMVDDEDYEFVMQHNWTAVDYKHTRYASHNLFQGHKVLGHVFLHRELLGLKRGDGIKVDHRDRNGLNCQRHNLRIATNSQNGANMIKPRDCGSRFKGVYLDKRRGTWQSGIKVAQKKRYLGAYAREEEAALAYNRAAVAAFGEFALLNTV